MSLNLKVKKIRKQVFLEQVEQVRQLADLGELMAPYFPEGKEEEPADALIDKAEKLNAGICAKMVHPFRVVKRQLGFVKVRYRGLKKSMAQFFMQYAYPICGCCAAD